MLGKNILKLGVSILSIGALLSTLIIPVNAAPSWKLIWSDEFDASSINKSNWTYDIGGSGWGNNELEYYTNRSENSRIEGGNLVIEARKEAYGGMNYTSARMKTQALQTFTYGKVEARMKLPAGQGIWPAFWMLGSNIVDVSWPKCGEIDIMEHINNEAVSHGTIHWDLDGHQYYGGPTPNIDVTQYHTYGIEWDDKAIKWFIDGTKYWEANIENNINGTDEFHKPFFVILNLAVGGQWPGNPDGSTIFPAKMYVDYVRVYQQDAGTPTVKYGDLNGDNTVNSTDYALIKRYLLGSITSFPSASGAKAADVNGDSTINSADLAFVKRYILNIIGKFPLE